MNNFDSAWKYLSRITTSFSKGVLETKNLAKKPDEVSIELGLKFSVEAGIIIAKTATEAYLKISLKWKEK